MSTLYQMQAKSSANARLYSWLAVAPDWTAAGYVAAGYPGIAQDIALTGGGLDNSAGLVDNQVTAGGVAVTASGTNVFATVALVTAGGTQVTAGGVNVAA